MATHAAVEKENPETELADANQRFYAAFESLDMRAMEEVWAHEDWIQCVQPGWELLLGWEDVGERWARIFANTKKVKIALSSVWVRAEGSVGWVACTEHVTTAFEEGFDEVIVQATNIFVRRAGRWLLVAHHASPIPVPSDPTVQ